ncbi:hypothetical protein [Ornithinimicrobium sp. INDO-MA30-4]|uniref:hypothetical protein n=1 Tax=Ornithinimicrobium sp. INDO-MA30-4 TaxID=2908651 RepID=UPI001F38F398|nr:hypothetical protein [Ornithinimicrobium sp. INDO-MA30-4]UJH70161.1 hypothetical protein L0A91_13340 [Ornithinimicrobium sp. INDO-MA30-4]
MDQVHFTVVQTVFEGHDQNTAEQAVASLKRHDITGVDLGHDSGEPPTIMADYRTGGTPWAVIIGPPQGPEGLRPVLANDFRVDAEVLVDSFAKLLAPADAQDEAEAAQA